MDLNPTLLSIYLICFAFATLTALVFPPIYQWTSRGWWKNDLMGIHVMAQGTIIALLFVFTWLSRVLPLWLVSIVGSVLCLGVAAVKINQMRLAIRRRLRDDRRAKELENARHARDAG